VPIALSAATRMCWRTPSLRIASGSPVRLRTGQWGNMEDGSARTGYFAVRVKSDVISEVEYGGTRTSPSFDHGSRMV
jgi:hypothetical protein